MQIPLLQIDPNAARGAGALMGGLCGLVFILAIVALMIFIWGTIFKKAGYSFWLALLMIVPLANLVWILIFAFSKWPIEQELENLRAGHFAGPRGGFPMPPPHQQ
jgi:hypothetical protein